MFKFKRLIVAILALSTTALGSGLPAQAVVAPALTIVNSGTSLGASRISNFDPAETLRLDLTIDSGIISVDVGNSGAVAAPGGSLTGASVAITGTQDQINGALGTTTVSENCTAARNIIGTVYEGAFDYVYNPDNGHFYLEGTNGGTWDDEKATADAMTLPNTTGHGYLATITSAAENTFINNHFSNTAVIGASDAASEGNWYWMDGPEAGTEFYSNGAAVNNQYINWNGGEPNNSNGGENYGQLWTGDTWNDIAGDGNYLVEFGGMPGDDFSGIKTATATTAITVPVALTGAGTSASPFLVSNQTDFSVVSSCSGAGVYFTQTADIATDGSFSGLASFSGHYDGDSKTIDLTASTSMAHALFGDISGASVAADTSVANLSVLGGSRPAFGCSLSIFANSISKSTIDAVNLSDATVTGDCQLSLFAGSITNSVIKNTGVSGTIQPQFMMNQSGALAGYASGSQFINDLCAVQFNAGNQIDPFMEFMYGVGGCVGRSDGSTYVGVSSSGNFSFPTQNFMMMGMFSIGGLIGGSSNDTVSNSSSSLNLDVSGNSANSVGGLIGGTDSSSISTSFATGMISAAGGQFIGGLVGYASSASISNSYATGAVTAESSSGSLAGELGNSSISKSYATGAVFLSEATTSHGLVGYADFRSSVTDSYWKINDAGVPSTVESIGTEAPRYSGDLKKITNYAGWNISATPNSTNLWAMCPAVNGGYPYLTWQFPGAGCERTFVPGATVGITGANYVGSTLSATTSSWDPLATIAYQWNADGAPLTGANLATLNLTDAMHGKVISLTVTGTNGPGYETLVKLATGTVVAAAPRTKLTVVGGFASGSKLPSKTTKLAVTSLLKNVGLLLTVKCDAFATAKKLSVAQKKIANARAAAVCAHISAAKPGAVVTLTNSVAKKSDKIKEGVRVTVTSVEP